jgi:hypothetical protein
MGQINSVCPNSLQSAVMEGKELEFGLMCAQTFREEFVDTDRRTPCPQKPEAPTIRTFVVCVTLSPQKLSTVCQR